MIGLVLFGCSVVFCFGFVIGAWWVSPNQRSSCGHSCSEGHCVKDEFAVRDGDRSLTRAFSVNDIASKRAV